MINNSLVRKIVLVVFLATLVAMPFVNLNCSIGSNDATLMCRMQTFTQAKIKFEQIKQLMIAIVSEPTYLFVLLLVVLVVPILLKIRYGQSINRNNFSTSIVNMKPWDSMRFAFARGIIHGKYFD